MQAIRRRWLWISGVTAMVTIGACCGDEESPGQQLMPGPRWEGVQVTTEGVLLSWQEIEGVNVYYLQRVATDGQEGKPPEKDDWPDDYTRVYENDFLDKDPIEVPGVYWYRVKGKGTTQWSQPLKVETTDFNLIQEPPGEDTAPVTDTQNQPVAALDQVVAVGAGERHTCALTADGRIRCWGDNRLGQLGSGVASGPTSMPTELFVTELRNWKTLAVGESSSCGIDVGGTLWCWGKNDYGQLGNGTVTDSAKPVSVVSGAPSWITVATGASHTCAIDITGALWCWGANEYGQLGDGTSLARSTPVIISGANRWIDVSVGYLHTCAIRQDRSLWCWGYNYYGEVGDGTITNRNVPVPVSDTSDWMRVECGDYHSCAIRRDGSLWCWGWNGFGQLGDGTATSTTTPKRIGGTNDWSAITAGYAHTCGIRRDESLWCWGWNGHQQLGMDTGASSNALRPQRLVGAGDAWAQVSAGYAHTCAVALPHRRLWCWGWNAYKQVGSGTQVDQATLTRVFFAVSIGGAW